MYLFYILEAAHLSARPIVNQTGMCSKLVTLCVYKECIIYCSDHAMYITVEVESYCPLSSLSAPNRSKGNFKIPYPAAMWCYQSIGNLYVFHLNVVNDIMFFSSSLVLSPCDFSPGMGIQIHSQTYIMYIFQCAVTMVLVSQNFICNKGSEI